MKGEPWNDCGLYLQSDVTDIMWPRFVHCQNYEHKIWHDFKSDLWKQWFWIIFFSCRVVVGISVHQPKYFLGWNPQVLLSSNLAPIFHLPPFCLVGRNHIALQVGLWVPHVWSMRMNEDMLVKKAGEMWQLKVLSHYSNWSCALALESGVES